MINNENSVPGIGYVDIEVKIIDNHARQKMYSQVGSSGPISLKIRAADREEVVESPAPLDLEKLYYAAKAPDYWSHDLAAFYGGLLYEWMFGGRLREELLIARSIARSTNRLIRFCLTIEESLGQYCGLRWESLFSKKDEEFLSQSMIFARVRHGRSRQAWPVVERPLRLRAIVANPLGMSALPQDELQRLEESLMRGVHQSKGMVTPHFSFDWKETQVPRSPHIVVLLGRAAIGNEPLGFAMSDAAGESTVPLRDVAERIISRESPPFLVVLATPSLGNPREATSFQSFADELIDRDVQAVLAVQGPMAMDRLAEFGGELLEAIIRNGEIDSAVRTARNKFTGQARGEWDWTFPVLTLRSPSARLFQPLSESLEAALPAY